MGSRPRRFDDDQKEAMWQAFIAAYAAARYRGHTFHELDRGTTRAVESSFDQWYSVNHED